MGYMLPTLYSLQLVYFLNSFILIRLVLLLSGDNKGMKGIIARTSLTSWIITSLLKYFLKHTGKCMCNYSCTEEEGKMGIF